MRPTGCHGYMSKHDDVTTVGGESNFMLAWRFFFLQFPSLFNPPNSFPECRQVAQFLAAVRRGDSFPSITHRTGWETKWHDRESRISAPAAMTTMRPVKRHLYQQNNLCSSYKINVFQTNDFLFACFMCQVHDKRPKSVDFLHSLAP